MNGFALLWGKILDSSIWVKESKETRLVWVTMLAMKNADGVIQASVIGLADRAKVSPDECRMALKIFLSPDPDDTSKVEDGRRIREVSGGWQIVNHDLYRFSTEAKREFWRQTKAEQRNRPVKRKVKNDWKNRVGSELTKGEQRYEKLAANGASVEELDRHITAHLPEKCQ
jgi:hypothetical protein